MFLRNLIWNTKTFLQHSNIEVSEFNHSPQKASVDSLVGLRFFKHISRLRVLLLLCFFTSHSIGLVSAGPMIPDASLLALTAVVTSEWINDPEEPKNGKKGATSATNEKPDANKKNHQYPPGFVGPIPYDSARILSFAFPMPTPTNTDVNDIGGGPQVWLRADVGVDLVGVTTMVGVWNDQSGGGVPTDIHNGTEDNEPDIDKRSLLPSWESNITNFNPGVRFVPDRSNFEKNERLDLETFILDASEEDLSVFIVFNTVDVSSNQRVLDQANGVLATDVPFNIRESNGPKFENLYGGETTDLSYTSMELVENIPVLAEFTSDVDQATPSAVSTITTFLNAREGVSGTRTIESVNEEWYLSTDRPDGFDGHINELIIYDQVLTDLERLEIQSYLAIKYGLTLSNDNNSNGTLAEVIDGAVNEGDYVDPDGNKIWDPTTTSYQNDIGGIGYETAGTDFEQLKSKSINPNSIITMEDVSTGDNTGRGYLIWGNDAASTNATTTDVPAGTTERVGRVWRVEHTTGGLDGVSIQFDLTGLGYDSKVFSDFTLITSATEVMANGTFVLPISLINNILTFDNVDFPIGESFFSLSVGTGPGPAGVFLGLQTWLKANAGTGAGPLVTSWADQSSKGYNATHATLGPTLTSGVSNFNPGLLFEDSNSERLDITGLTLNPNSNDITTFTVFSTVDNTKNQAILGQTGSAEVHLGINGGSNKLTNQFGIGLDGASTVENNTAVLGGYSSVPGSPSVNLYKDGTVDGTSSGAAANTTGSWRLGADQDPAGFLDGYMNEVIVFDRILSDLERLRVDSYLAIKYGITLTNDNDGDLTAGEALTGFTEGDYVDPFGNAIWDYTAAYHNDIAGLGYTGIGLSQLKSKSQNTSSIVTMEDANGGATSGDPANGFLIWGNDDDVTTSTTSDLPVGSNQRMERIWRVQYSNGGFNGLSVQFDLTGLGYSGNSVDDFGLIVSSSSAMANGTVVLPTSFNSDILTFDNVDFPTGESFFTISLSTSSSPGGVAVGLQTWLRGDIGVTGTTSVTAWSDQSPQMNGASHGTLGPGLTTGVSNFNPGLLFDNTDRLDMVGFGFDPSSQNLTTFSVFRTNDNTKDQTVLAQNNGSGTGEVHLGVDGTYNTLRNQFSGTNQDGGLTILNNASIIGGYGWDQSNLSLFKDGAVDGSSTVTPTSADGDWIIGATKTPDNFFDGYINEVVIYNGVLSDLGRLKVESYLAIKYGVTLTDDNDGDATAGEALTGFIEGDYLNAFGDKIWNYTAAYHNDIAGIGYDPIGTNILQKKSKSQNAGSIVTIEDTNAGEGSGDPASGFIVWGNDAADATAAMTNTADVPSGSTERMTRIWRMQYTSGGLSDISIQFDLTGLGYGLKDINDFQLIMSNSATMTNGTLIDPSSYSSDILTFDNIDFTAGSTSFFTISVSRLSAPGGVSAGIKNWLRADVGVTGTTEVTEWADQSINAENASDADNAGLGPELMSSVVNFNPALYFDYTNSEELVLSARIKANEDLSIFAPFIVDEGSMANRTVLGTRGTRKHNAIQTFPNGSINSRWQQNLAWGDPFTSDVLQFLSLTTERIGVTVSSTLTLYRDGSLSRSNSRQLYGDSKWVLGNNSDRLNPFSGYIPEVIFYGESLSDDDRQRVDSYLALKYGATLSHSTGTTQGDYVASDPNITFWDASVNASYHNDVAGIGLDLVSNLSQKQSKSVNSTALVTIGLDDDVDGFEASNTLNNGSFSANHSFLMWGHDGAALGGATSNPAGVNSLLNRKWRVQETGTVGTVTVQFELNTLPHLDGAGLNDESKIVLLISDEANFSSSTATVTIISQSFVTPADDLANFRVDFPNGAYFTLGSSEGGALPITLLAFEGKASSNHIELEWSTSSETNNAFFNIERRMLSGAFERIGSVTGAGTSSAIQNYSFKDSSPQPGENYYRIVDFSKSGEKGYSEIIRVVFSNLEQLSLKLKLYPNPVNQGESFFLEVSDVPMAFQMQMLDAQGRLVLDRTEEGVTQVEVSTETIKAGVYIVRCTLPDGNQAYGKIVVRN